jgi:hypothetical protein
MSARTVERAEGFLAFAVAVTTLLHSEQAEGFLASVVAFTTSRHNERTKADRSPRVFEPSTRDPLLQGGIPRTRR